jgi:hypothetical protein
MKNTHLLLKTGFLLLSLVPVALMAQNGMGKIKQQSKVSIDLRSMKSLPSALPTEATDMLVKDMPYLQKEGMICIDAVAAGQDGASLLGELQAIGLQKGSYYQRMVSGFLPIDKIDQLEAIVGLQFASPSLVPQKSAGIVTSQGDVSLKADIARASYGVDGTGSKVGILSDSYNRRGGAAAGVASGDLPSDVEIVEEYTGPGFIDEGRAMAEIVHDVAPGAKIAFHTAFTGQAGFANGIRALADAGCNIIVDDVFYFAEPYFQDGLIAQAVDEVVKRKVTYFSAAGNGRDNSYESIFSNAGEFIVAPAYGLGQPHNFGAGDWKQSITLNRGQRLRLGLQWDDPFFSVTGDKGTATDMDILVYLNGSLLLSLSGLSDNVASKDPVEIIGLNVSPFLPTPTITIEIALVKFAGPDPKNIKWVNFGNGSFPPFIEYLNNKSTVLGHANAKGAIAVGASAWFNTPAYNPALTSPVINSYSSLGGTPVFFMPNGKRTGVGDGKYRQKPDITGPDGGNNTFFGVDNAADADAFPNFFGTSAAAPHAAAVAALMQQVRNQTMTPAAILDMSRPKIGLHKKV